MAGRKKWKDLFNALPAERRAEIDKRVARYLEGRKSRPSKSDATIAAVRAWQANPAVHPLTCGNDSQHAPLYAVKEGRKVVLRCAECDYEQAHIPEIVVRFGGRVKAPTKGARNVVSPIAVDFEEAVKRLMKVKPTGKRR